MSGAGTRGLGDLLDGVPPEQLAVVLGDERVTHGELIDDVDRIATALAELGLEPGQAVGVCLPNGPGLIATLFGVWRAGGVYVPLNPRLTQRERDVAIGATRPAIVVTDADRRLVDDGRRYDDDVALVQFTSGTTGKPKPVLLNHSGVLQLLDGVITKLRGKASSSSGMPNLIPVSLSLWAGIYNVLFAFRVGAPVVIMDGFDTRAFASLVAEHGIRSTVLPPAAMAMLADDDAVTDLAPLRFVRSITAPLSPLQARRFNAKFGVSVLNSYGQTEIGGEVVGWTAADSRAFGIEKLGSVGRPHEGVDMRIVDVGGTPVPAGEPGELLLRTPAMSRGYADGSDLSDRLTADGWFRTGDVARVDAEGFLWIDGRVSNMINRGGLKVHPGEVEEVIRLEPTIADVTVVGVPDERLGEVPWAFVVARPDTDLPAAATLAEQCRAQLAPYKVPVRFEAIDALPRNEVGKVLVSELVARAAADRAADPTP